MSWASWRPTDVVHEARIARPAETTTATMSSFGDQIHHKEGRRDGHTQHGPPESGEPLEAHPDLLRGVRQGAAEAPTLEQRPEPPALSGPDRLLIGVTRTSLPAAGPQRGGPRCRPGGPSCSARSAAWSRRRSLASMIASCGQGGSRAPPGG